MTDCCGEKWVTSGPLTVRKRDILFIRSRSEGGIEVNIAGCQSPVIFQEKDAKLFLSAFFNYKEDDNG